MAEYAIKIGDRYLGDTNTIVLGLSNQRIKKFIFATTFITKYELFDTFVQYQLAFGSLH